MFKKSSKKKGAIRKRKLSEDEEQKEVDLEEVEKLKLAKLKRELLTKKAGVSAVALAKGKKISKKAELTDDPFKLKSGKSGLIFQVFLWGWTKCGCNNFYNRDQIRMQYQFQRGLNMHAISNPQPTIYACNFFQ